MAAPQKLDVWLIASDTVYTGVPLQVVLGWASQGRLGPNDQVRPHGTQAWVLARQDPQLRDFLARPTAPSAIAVPPTATANPASSDADLHEPIELDVGWTKPAEEEDDDVDMIPLIDISLVLLIFFMMTATVAALSPIDVPSLRYAGELSKDQEAITLMIDKRGGEPVYALRVGDKPPEREDSELSSLGLLMNRLDARLASGTTSPPEIRIAAEKTLPRRHIRELAQELSKRKAKGQIAFYGAEVNELNNP